MVYPNITDKETRRVIAKQLITWRKRHNEEKKSKVPLMAQWTREWIYGFRRALEIINNP